MRKIKTPKNGKIEVPAGVDQADVNRLALALSDDPNFQASVKEAVRQLQAGRPFDEVMENVVFLAARKCPAAVEEQKRIESQKVVPTVADSTNPDVTAVEATETIVTDIPAEPAKENTTMPTNGKKSSFTIVNATNSKENEAMPKTETQQTQNSNPVADEAKPMTKEDVLAAVEKTVSAASKVAHAAIIETQKVVNRQNAEKVATAVGKAANATGKNLWSFARLVGKAAKDGWNEAGKKSEDQN